MRLTDEQRTVVGTDGNVAVNACPGSGKTRALVAKAVRCLEQSRGTTRHVACLTYTNAAANEISARAASLLSREDADRLYTATLHAFCARHLLRPYHWASDGYARGFLIAAPGSDAYETHARAAFLAHGISNARALDELENVGRAADGRPVCHDPLTPASVAEFWRRMQTAGLIDFPTLLYESWRICERLPAVVRGIASRYAWVLVDEFQDTTDVQVEILLRVASYRRSRFMIVGDPCQSIFRFAGARPEFFERFAVEVRARSDVTFSDNFRSSEKVVDVAQAVIRRAPTMRAAGRHRESACLPTWVECRDPAAAITARIMPELETWGIRRGGTAVLAPWFRPLYEIGQQLRRRGLPIVGPGARPYRRRHLAVPLAECLAACSSVGRASSRHWVEREILEIVRQVSKEAGPVDIGEVGRIAAAMIAAARRLRRGGAQAEGWLTGVAELVGMQLEDAGLVTKLERERIEASGHNVVAEAKRLGDISSVTVEHLAEFVRPTDHVQLLTVHRAKGREYDAVILIDAHDGRFPHFTAKTPEDVEDGRRLFYVALTRARQALYILSGHDARDAAPSRFLTETELPLRCLAI